MSANHVKTGRLLSAYDFDIRYIKRVDNARVDGLSRIPLACKEERLQLSAEEYRYLNFVSDEIKSIDSKVISVETSVEGCKNESC